MTPRDRILARLRHGRTASPAAPFPAPAPAPPTAGAIDLDGMIAALQGAHAEVFRQPAGAWQDHLADLAQSRGWRNWWIGRDSAGKRWQRHASQPSTTVFTDWESQKVALFDEAEASLSEAQGAIAETGTLIVESSALVPRTLSLVPPVHVIVVHESTVHATLRDALAAYGQRGLPTNLIFISGPSKTADIQQTLAYGAHGPRELIVYLCS